MGLTLSEEKTSITHWEKPIRFLGYDIHGVQRAKGVQITAVLSSPKRKNERSEGAFAVTKLSPHQSQQRDTP